MTAARGENGAVAEPRADGRSDVATTPAGGPADANEDEPLAKRPRAEPTKAGLVQEAPAAVKQLATAPEPTPATAPEPTTAPEPATVTAPATAPAIASATPPAEAEKPATAQGDGPPKFGGDDYVTAADGWWAHKGGQWLYNVQEKTYFHLPTGQLHLATEDGATALLDVSDASAGPKFGRVRWFDAAKGYGFISPEDGSQDLFVHRNQLLCDDDDVGADIFMSLRKGVPVTYALGETDGGRPCAVGVRLVGKRAAGSGDEGEEGSEDDEGDGAESSAESVDIDLEEELGAGVYQEKGAGKDNIEDYVVQKAKLPISVLGETATCLFFGVFDGHGGETCAEYTYNHLAKNVLARLRDRTKNASDEVALRTALAGGFKQTEHNFLQHAKRVGDNSGTTACTMTVFGPDEQMRLRLFFANAGDSRAVLGKASGATVRLTQDHKPNSPAEKKRIEAEGGGVANVKGTWRCILPAKKRATSSIVGLAVSRSLGDKDFKQPDIVSAEPEITIHEVDWDADEFVILATDGIWDVITDRNAVRLVQRCLREGASEEKAAEVLVKRAGELGSPDDRTALVVRFGWLKTSQRAPAEAAADAGGDDDEDVDDDVAEPTADAMAAASARFLAQADAQRVGPAEDDEGEEEEDMEDGDDSDEEGKEAAGRDAPALGASVGDKMAAASAKGGAAASGGATVAADMVGLSPAATGEGAAATGAAPVSRAVADDDDIFAAVLEDDAVVPEDLPPAAFLADVSAGPTGVAGTAADPAGLFEGLTPAQEDIAEAHGPRMPRPGPAPAS